MTLDLSENQFAKLPVAGKYSAYIFYQVEESFKSLLTNWSRGRKREYFCKNMGLDIRLKESLSVHNSKVDFCINALMSEMWLTQEKYI